MVIEAELPAEEGAVTLASAVYRRLRQDIIAGHLKPNAKLNIKQLCEQFGSALSPVREALNRLAPEGLVQQIDNRGFVVAPISVSEMNDLTLARCWMNEFALRDAITHGDTAWEENLVLALHRLSRTPRGENDEAQHETWSRMHRDFHSALIAGCRSKRILRYCEETFLSAERYRHIARRSSKRWVNKVDHDAITQAALDRKADLAVELLNRHFLRTAELVESVLAKAGV